jgi:hypothetical protein
LIEKFIREYWFCSDSTYFWSAGNQQLTEHAKALNKGLNTFCFALFDTLRKRNVLRILEAFKSMQQYHFFGFSVTSVNKFCAFYETRSSITLLQTITGQFSPS